MWYEHHFSVCGKLRLCKLVSCPQVEKKAQSMSQVLKDCLHVAVTKTAVTTTSGIGRCGVVMVTDVTSHMI